MGWGANTWLRAMPETTYATFNSGGTPLWFRLTGDTAFDMLATPQRKEINSADGGNEPVQDVSSRTKVGGMLTTPLYPTQAAAILAMATSFTAGDLNSWTLDYFDSFEVIRHLGAKIESYDLSCAAETDEGVVMQKIGLVAQQVTTATLAQPAFTVFPTENPYVHKESSTGFTIGGAVRTKYNKFSMSIKNKLAAPFDEQGFISSLTYCGRTVDFSTNCQYNSATDRTAFEAQTALVCSALFTKVSPAHTLLLDWKSSSYGTDRKRATPLGDISRQDLSYRAFFDATALKSFSFTAT